MNPLGEEALRAQVVNLKSGIREIAHEISNPLGVLRMAAYYLQRGSADKEKREHYYAIIAESVGKVETSLNKLRALYDTIPTDAKEEGEDK
jgi:nitrogen-specific signal transduction histidine kinase